MNAVESSQEMQVKKNVRDVRMPMKLVHEVLAKAGKLEGRQKKEEGTEDQEKCFYQYYGSTTDHSIQEFPYFLELIQEMMNEGELEFCGKVEQNVSILLKKKALKPLTIFYRGGNQQATKKAPRLPTLRLVVKIPAPFRYTSDNAVPWNYSSQAVMQEP